MVLFQGVCFKTRLIDGTVSGCLFQDKSDGWYCSRSFVSRREAKMVLFKVVCFKTRVIDGTVPGVGYKKRVIDGTVPGCWFQDKSDRSYCSWVFVSRRE